MELGLDFEKFLVEWFLRVELDFFLLSEKVHFVLESELILSDWKLMRSSPFHWSECWLDFVRGCH